MNETACVEDARVVTAKFAQSPVVGGCAGPASCSGGTCPPVLEWIVTLEAGGTVPSSVVLDLTLPSPAVIHIEKVGTNYQLAGNSVDICDTVNACNELVVVRITGIPEGTAATLRMTLQEHFPAVGSLTIHQRPCNGRDEVDFFGYTLRNCDKYLTDVPQRRELDLLGLPQLLFLESGALAPAVSMASGSKPDRSKGLEEPVPWRTDRNVNDTTRTTTTAIQAPDLSPASCCSAELAVFAKDRSPWFAPSKIWRKTAAADFGVRLDKPRELPLKIWVFQGASLTDAKHQLSNAKDLYRRNWTGIRFDAAIIDRTTRPGPTSCEVDFPASFSDSYDKNAMNVYFSGNSTVGDKYCSDHDRLVAFVGTGTTNVPTSPTTLAHELGHALGLSPEAQGGHTDEFVEGASRFRQGFGNDNAMWTSQGAVGKGDRFSLGQIFRMHTHCASVLPKLAPLPRGGWPWGWFSSSPGGSGYRSRSDVVRECYPRDSSLICPDLRLDVYKRSKY